MIRLETNYRSSPQVIELANRLLARTPRTVAGPPKRLVATRPDGPPPAIRQFPTGDEEERAIAAEARRLIAEGVAPEEIAVLVRTNGQLVGFEAAFRAAGVPFQLRGERFFSRPEIRRAIAVGPGDAARAPEADRRHGAAGCRAWAGALDFRPDDVPAGEEARQRHGALLALLEVGRELEAADPEADVASFLAEVDRRAAAEADGSAGSGVELLTYHRAKGLEWDAVFLPALEEGILPIRQATRSRRARGGAPPALRRDHPGARPPLAVVGAPARRTVDRPAPVALPARDPAGAGEADTGRACRRPAGAVPGRRTVPSPAGRCSTRSGRGAWSGRGAMPCRRT